MSVIRLFTAMVTPFDARFQVDFARAGELATHLVEQGADGLVVAGSTGEGPVLDSRERLGLFETVVARVGGRATVVASTGSNCTAATITRTREAAKTGIHACMVVVPYYNKPSQEGMYRHFAAVAEAAPVPLMVYNVPGRTGANLLPATLARLARLGNLRWVKEAAGSLDQASEYVLAVRETAVDVLSGDDSLTLPLLSVGAKGVVSVASHLVGAELRSMMEAYSSGRVGEAAAGHQRLFPLFRGLFLTTNPVPVKAALALAGFDVGPPRLPLVPATGGELETLRAILADLGLLAG